MVEEVVAQNGDGFYSAETFNSTTQRLRRTVASSVSAFRAKFQFDLGVLYIMVALLLLFCFLSSVFVLVRFISWPAEITILNQTMIQIMGDQINRLSPSHNLLRMNHR